MSERYAHVDGAVVPLDEATVSVRDRGFRYGDAAFETVRVYGGRPFRWDAHMDRLAETCDLLSLDHGLARSDLRERLTALLDANGFREASVRLSVTRGVDDGGIVPDPDPDPTVVVTATPLPRGGRGSESTWDGPATLQTVKTRRVPDRAIPSRAKTHNYLNGVLAGIELQVTGADEALVLDLDGHVAEGTTSNLFFVDDRAVHTPSLDGPVLPGVTRDAVLELAREEGLPAETGAYTPDDFRRADEVFLTSSTREVRPVDTVDGISVGTGPVATLLGRLYDELIERECYAAPAGEDESDADGTDAGDADAEVDAPWSPGAEGAGTGSVDGGPVDDGSSGGPPTDDDADRGQ
jgi:branched-chain amino acid aminotransferase